MHITWYYAGENLYSLVHAILIGGLNTYKATGSSRDAVACMWASSIEECTVRILTTNRCRTIIDRLFERYHGTAVTTDQLVRDVSTAGVRGGRPTALTVIAEMVSSGHA